jgi:hypothetical protein
VAVELPVQQGRVEASLLFLALGEVEQGRRDLAGNGFAPGILFQARENTLLIEAPAQRVGPDAFLVQAGAQRVGRHGRARVKDLPGARCAPASSSQKRQGKSAWTGKARTDTKISGRGEAGRPKWSAWLGSGMSLFKLNVHHDSDLFRCERPFVALKITAD